MLGKTHVAVGVATSLAIIQPASSVGLLSSVAGGALGGWICDIDCKEVSVDEGAAQGFLLTSLVVGLSLFLDYKLDNGVCDYVLSHWGLTALISVVLFVIACIYGFSSSHRTFMHSIIALLLLPRLVSVFCLPLAKAFSVGYLSHIILDLFNKRGLQLFFPLKARICFNACDSNGRANDILWGFAGIISMVLIGWRFVSTFSVESINIGGGFLGTLPHLSPFVSYLVKINIATFIIFCLDFWICKHTGWVKDENYTHSILNLLAVAGGAYGMLLSFLVLRQKIGKHNANWQIIGISLALIWTIIIAIVCDPLNIGFETTIHPVLKDHLWSIGYLLAINVITGMAFFLDRNRFRPKWTLTEFLLVILGLLGGTLGALVVMTVTGSKSHFPHFSTGFFILLIAQAAFWAFLFYAGIA